MAEEMIGIIVTGLLAVAVVIVLFAGNFFMTASGDSTPEQALRILDSMAGDIKDAARSGGTVNEIIFLPYGTSIIYMEIPHDTAFIDADIVNEKCREKCLCVGAMDGVGPELMYLFKCISIGKLRDPEITNLELDDQGSAWPAGYPGTSCDSWNTWAIPQCVVPHEALYSVNNITGEVVGSKSHPFVTLKYSTNYS